jgi:hypothetical protein
LRSLTPAYGDNLKTFVDSVLRDLGAALRGVIVKARNGGNLGPIQAGLGAMAHALNAVVTVEMADLSQCFHYDWGAQLMIGEPMAAVVLNFMG